MPPSGDGAFDYNFCFDRRGDKEATVYNMGSMKDLHDFWGSEEHWKRYDEMPNPESCPRCTLKPHAQIIEQVVQQEGRDNTTWQFI